MINVTQEENDLEWSEDQLKERFYKTVDSGLEKIGVLIIPENEVIKEKPEIGKGSFGKVYKGLYNGNKIAIKKILLNQDAFEEIGTNDKVAKEILNEINSLLLIQHESIPKFYGICKRKGNYNLIFELIEGESLATKHQTLTSKEKLIILSQLTNILSEMHSKKLFHRDIKPSNIMVVSGPKLKLIDFGVSKLAKNTITYTQNQNGTTRYMAPENFDIQFDSDIPLKISAKLDIWSIGCLISEIFSGQIPWKGTDEYKIIARLANKVPFPIPLAEIQKVEEVDGFTIVDLIKKCVEIDPANRVSSSELTHLITEKLEKIK